MKKIFFSSLLVLLTMVGIAPRLAAQTTPQYGVELLTNIPPAATNIAGWVATSERADCIPECSEGWFKTSHKEGSISQTIDLPAHGYTPIADNTLFLYAATEYYVGQTGSSDGIAKMYVECLDVDNKVLATHSVLNRTGKFGKVDSTLVSDTMMIPANTTQLRYVLKGKDQPGWAGYYGPWFRNMSCKIFNAIHSDESIQVSVAEEVKDKITLSKTADFHYGDTITVSLVNSEDSIIWLTANEGLIINTNQVICWGENIVIGAQLKQSAYNITCNGTHATITANTIQAGSGETISLNCTMDEGYLFQGYITNVRVTWVDANSFIMPEAPVTVGNIAITPKSIPYFEGFENGNFQNVVVANWSQQSENGSDSWVANSTYTSYNRTPHAGSSWNATLRCSNTDWLFQSLALEAGENYVLSLYARQDYESTSYANITAKLGTACSKDAMTTTLIPETGLTNGDYQLLTDTFQVTETKAYVLGIRGSASSACYYISMDNILVEQEVYPASVGALYFDVLTEDAARTALAALSLTAVDTKGNTKCTITNLPENWVLDFENKKATYTAADSLLPMGYYCTDTITVDLVINQYTLTINEASNGSITGTSGTYDYGTEVTLTATADEHYHFVQWSDGATEATYTFTLTQDTTLTATFAIDQYTVMVTAGENGTVKMEVDGEKTIKTVFDYGTEITLTATAEEGYHFVQWSNDTWANPYILTLTDDITLMAVFEKDPEYNAVGGLFSVGEGTQVQFSAGNLQYTQSAAMWSFAANQYDMFGTTNEKNGALANKIDLFGWSGNTAIAKWGISTSTSTSDYSGDFADWGQNVGDGNTWRTLTKSEWDYLFDTRANAANLMGAAAIQITESEKAYGLILLPDNWNCPETVTFKPGFATTGAVEEFANYQTFTLAEWALLESAGAVFLPAAGTVYGLSDFREICRNGRYWSSTAYTSSTAWYMSFYPDAKDRYHYERSWRLSVRLVQDYYTVTATCDEEQGSISGAGTYLKGTEVTLTATANTGYSFDKWSDGNTDNPRIITVTENVTLTATFTQDAPTQLSETNAETKVEKVLRNGQVLIIRNGNTYDLTGRKQKSGK